MIFEFCDNLCPQKFKKDFTDNSVIQINKTISKDICLNAYQYFLANEQKSIDKYIKDARGLVLDNVDCDRSKGERLSFFGVDSEIRYGHEEWDNKMVSLNRN